MRNHLHAHNRERKSSPLTWTVQSRTTALPLFAAADYTMGVVRNPANSFLCARVMREQNSHQIFLLAIDSHPSWSRAYRQADSHCDVLKQNE